MRRVPRKRIATEQWDAFVEAHEHGWFFHTSRWIAYAVAYTPGAVDRSYAFVDDTHAIRLICAGVTTPDGTFNFGGQPLPEGLCDGEVASPYQIIRPCVVAGRPGQPEHEDVPHGVVRASWPTYVVDLRPDEKVLWRNLRKSYKSLALRLTRDEGVVSVYGSGLYGNAGDVAIKAAQRLHMQAAGRQTRPDATWDLMGQWMRDGDALLALAQRGLVYTGFAYVIRWKHWAYYASGASLERNVSHGLLWHIMKTLKCDGRTTHFEIGWGHRPDDTEKDCGVHHFKAGFGGDEWTVHALERRA